MILTNKFTTVIERLKQINLSRQSVETRLCEIERIRSSGEPLELCGDTGYITVDEKPIRVVLHQGEVYYCLRDVLNGAGVTKGYRKDQREKLRELAVLGPGTRNPAHYVPKSVLHYSVQTSRYKHSQHFVGKVIAAVTIPSYCVFELLILIQSHPVNERKAAFAALEELLTQASMGLSLAPKNCLA